MRSFLLLAAAAGAALAQQSSDVIIRHAFDGDGAGWITMGQGGEVRAGGGSLAVSYEIAPKRFASAVLPVSGLAGLGRIRFRAKADHDTALAVLLSEKKPGGGNYWAWFWAPAGQWQQIELAPADFSASDGPQDPVDADGRLDPEAIEGVGVFDVGQFLSQLPEDPNFSIARNRASGQHTFWVSDFQLLRSPGPPRSARPGAIPIDRFDRGFLEWLTLGGMKLKPAEPSGPLGAHALEASYKLDEGQIGVMIHRLSNLDLSKATRLTFDMASEREVTLAISLESKKPGAQQGPRYNLNIYPPGGKEVFHVNVKLADFEGQGQIDPAQLKSLNIADVSAAFGGSAAPNTIWIGNLEARTN